VPVLPSIYSGATRYAPPELNCNKNLMSEQSMSTRRSITANRQSSSEGLPVRTSKWLIEQHRHKCPFSALPLDCVPADVAQAYAIQDAFVDAKARDCGAPMGWKIALSNQTMQQFVGLTEPIAGRLHSKQVVASPAHTRVAGYGRLLIEFEIAVELGQDLAPRSGGYDRDSVSPAVAAVRPAFELADDRGADYSNLNLHGLQLVADNAWNEGAVLGQPRTDWQSLDLAAIAGIVTLDGKVIGNGFGRDLLGHPLDALAWLANHTSKRGLTMRAGEVAILGSLVTSKFPVTGQRFEFALEGFAPIVLSID
jgi:2-keto-4-pentenoate hydratase